MAACRIFVVFMVDAGLLYQHRHAWKYCRIDLGPFALFQAFGLDTRLSAGAPRALRRVSRKKWTVTCDM